jgi:hypothetical protein
VNPVYQRLAEECVLDNQRACLKSIKDEHDREYGHLTLRWGIEFVPAPREAVDSNGEVYKVINDSIHWGDETVSIRDGQPPWLFRDALDVAAGLIKAVDLIAQEDDDLDGQVMTPAKGV